MGEEILKLFASFDDGKLIIERQDGQPISIFTHDDTDFECVEVPEFGSFGHVTKALQCLLNAHGKHLEEDGIFGKCTQEELLAFQSEKNIPQTGVCDTLTWGTLIKG